MKGDYYLSDLKKKTKKCEKFLKKPLSNRIRFLLIINFPMRPELVFVIAFRLLGTPN